MDQDWFLNFADEAPSTPKAPPTQTVDLSTPRSLRHLMNDPAPPSGPQPAPLARACHRLLPLTHAFVPVMIKNLSFTTRLGLAPANSLTLVQHNSLCSWDLFPSLFSSFAEGPPVDIVLLQVPPSSKGFLPSFCGFKSFAPPVARPRVACYVSQRFLQCFAILPFFPLETEDFMALDVFTPRGCFGSNFPRFRIGKSYGRPLPLPRT